MQRPSRQSRASRHDDSDPELNGPAQGRTHAVAAVDALEPSTRTVTLKLASSSNDGEDSMPLLGQARRLLRRVKPQSAATYTPEAAISNVTTHSPVDGTSRQSLFSVGSVSQEGLVAADMAWLNAAHLSQLKSPAASLENLLHLAGLEQTVALIGEFAPAARRDHALAALEQSVGAIQAPESANLWTGFNTADTTAQQHGQEGASTAPSSPDCQARQPPANRPTRGRVQGKHEPQAPRKSPTSSGASIATQSRLQRGRLRLPDSGSSSPDHTLGQAEPSQTAASLPPRQSNAAALAPRPRPRLAIDDDSTAGSPHKSELELEDVSSRDASLASSPGPEHEDAYLVALDVQLHGRKSWSKSQPMLDNFAASMDLVLAQTTMAVSPGVVERVRVPLIATGFIAVLLERGGRLSLCRLFTLQQRPEWIVQRLVRQSTAEDQRPQRQPSARDAKMQQEDIPSPDEMHPCDSEHDSGDGSDDPSFTPAAIATELAYRSVAGLYALGELATIAASAVHQMSYVCLADVTLVELLEPGVVRVKQALLKHVAEMWGLSIIE